MYRLPKSAWRCFPETAPGNPGSSPSIPTFSPCVSRITHAEICRGIVSGLFTSQWESRKVIKEKTRYREVGEWQNVYYNPANPNEAFSELMRKEILKESLFKAAFTFLFATGLIISIGRYLYVVLMEYGINYIELLKRILL